MGATVEEVLVLLLVLLLVLKPMEAVANVPVAFSEVKEAEVWDGEEGDGSVGVLELDEALPPYCRGSVAWRCTSSSSSSSSSSIKICSKPLVDTAEMCGSCAPDDSAGES